MAYISAIGGLFRGSNWVDIFKRSKINTVGRIESFLRGTNVKRSCYVHQVSLASLVHLLNIAFKDQTEFESYDIGRNEVKKRSANVCYWLTIIDMEVILFMFIKSISTADFDIFVPSISDIIPWMFSLSIINCSRWLLLFLHDMKYVRSTKTEAFNQLAKGRFTVKKVLEFS